MAYTNIDDPSAYFQTATYTGAGANTEVTNDGNSDLKPDFLWIKNRGAAYDHVVWDSNRNLGSATNAPLLKANTTDAENSTQNWWNATNNGINTDGFQFGSSQFFTMNYTSNTYVAWQWKANGGSTSTDTTSSITSTVQVNSDAGFSIVTYTGDGTTTGGFGHGLGVAPKVVFVKRRNGAANWCVYHESIGAGFYLQLDTTAAQQSGPWQNLAPSSTTVIVYGGNLVNGSGDTYVAYCFAEKQGYSKFGKYVGNGSNTDGAFIYTGFKPAFIIAKRIDAAAHNWFMWDTKRAPFNLVEAVLKPNSSAAESTLFQIDILSNGFKHYNNYGSTNESGGEYIYMAFAENPFVTSTGIPTTAR
jgi:hypothetical protein